MKICSVCRRCYDDASALCRDESHPDLTLLRDGDRQLVEGYRLDSLLSTEPQGHTFRAHQTASDKECRIRIVTPSADARDAFLREAKLAAGFYHPNVADIYEVGTLDDGDVFVVSEFTEARTARDLLVDMGPPELLTSVAIIRQVAEALHAMHLAGLNHGAVSPDNILLSRSADGTVLARIQNPDLGAVVRHSILSNKFVVDAYLDLLRYCSPEQFSDTSTDPRSDVYALGIVFYELLAGVPPFVASSATGLIHKHRNEVAAELKIDNFELRMLVTHSLTEALQKPQRLRQATANVLARQLRHIEQLATHSSTPPPASASAATPSRPRKAMPAAVVVAPPREVEIPATPTPVAVHTVVEAGLVTESPDPVSTVTPMEEVALPVDMAPAAPTPAVSEAAVEQDIQPPKRSRLKVLKKKLHAMSSVIASKIVAEAAPTQLALADDAGPSVERPNKPAPRKIEWTTPEDDIPTIAEAAAALADAPNQVTSALAASEIKVAEVIEPAPPPIPVPEVIAEPTAPPVIRAAEPAPAREKVEVAAATPVQPAKPKPVIRLKGKKPVTAGKPVAREAVASLPIVIQPSPDEITLVRPVRRNRIRIDLDRAPARRPKQRRPVPQAEFYPTLIGKRAVPTPVAPPKGDAMFASYYDEAASGRSIPYRSLSAAGGVIVLAALFLFANDTVSKFFQSAVSGDSVTAKATSSEQTLPATTEDTKPAPAKPVAGTRADGSRTAPKPMAEKVSPVARKETSKPERNNASDNAKTKTRTEAVKRTAEKAPSTAKKTEAGTRPRVVRESRQ